MTTERPDDRDDTANDVLEQSLAELRAAPVPDGPPPALVADTLAALREAARTDRRQLKIQRSTTMRYLTRIAAALVLIAGTAAMLFLAGKTSAVALADVVQKVRDAKTLTYTVTSTSEATGTSVTLKNFQLGDGRERIEFPTGSISITDPRARKTLMLDPRSKTAFVSEFTAGADALHYDPVAQLKSLRDAGAKDLGVKEVAGRKLHGFASTSDTPRTTVWVDPQSGTPVSVEFTVPVSGSWSKIVMTDFVVDAKLDESLFSLEVPAGYKLHNQDGVPAARAVAIGVDPEQHVIEALRGYARLANGKFPAKLDDWSAYITRLTEGGRAMNDDDSKLIGHVGAITPFLVSLPRDAWAYTGDGKSQGDKDALIFWYRKPDNTHRALYGDLTFRTVKAEDLPAAEKSPGAAPK